MRILAASLLLGALLGLPGCGGDAPVDPYTDMKMLSSAELGVSNTQIDPVEVAEKAQNAQFPTAPKGR